MAAKMPTTKSCQLRNAIVHIGDGTAASVADVQIADGVIAALLPPGSALQAERSIDADGLCLTPGFIDIHSHSDGALAHPAAAELLEPFLLQGITT